MLPLSKNWSPTYIPFRFIFQLKLRSKKERTIFLLQYSRVRHGPLSTALLIYTRSAYWKCFLLYLRRAEVCCFTSCRGAINLCCVLGTLLRLFWELPSWVLRRGRALFLFRFLPHGEWTSQVWRCRLLEQVPGRRRGWALVASHPVQCVIHCTGTSTSEALPTADWYTKHRT